ncbi:MAG: MBL fold metallo-hydrolase [Flavobacteriaceae bacterium]
MQKIILAVFVFFSFNFVSTAQTDTGDAYNIKLNKVSRNVYMLQGKGGNMGLSLGHDGIFMIDDQFEEGIPDILKKIRKLNKKPIKYLVNTHHHPDHIGGNILMANEGVTIFSHENARKRIDDFRKNSSDKIDSKILPIITITEDLTFYFNGEKIMIFHVHNAHTDGDIMVYFTNSNVIHTGDAFVNGLYPFIDHESGGSLEGYYSALEKILMISDEYTKIIPGHGELATTQDVKKSLDMITLIWKRVNHHFINKKTVEEIIELNDFTLDFDEQGFGNGFITTEKFIRIVYKDLEIENGPIDNRTMEKRLQDKVKEQKAKKQGKN